MRHDPSGALAVFWAEQRRMLDKKTHQQKQWNPEVHIYYMYFYACNNYYLLFVTCIYYLFFLFYIYYLILTFIIINIMNVQYYLLTYLVSKQIKGSTLLFLPMVKNWI